MDTKMTPREILEKVKERIMAEPLNYDQHDFCHMACCIGGHIDVILNGMESHLAKSRARNGVGEINDLATRAMGASFAPWLFGSIRPSDEIDYDEDDVNDPDYWPADLSDEYVEAGSGPNRALVGCKAIDRYIAERGL